MLGGILLTVILLRLWPKNIEQTQVEIAGQRLSVLVADDALEQYQGLSDRESLYPYGGMLFVFNSTSPRTFVMRRMRFPLDIIWVDGDKIVDVASNLPPEFDRSEVELTRYSGQAPADKVLEVPAGFADTYRIKAGDKISIIRQ